MKLSVAGWGFVLHQAVSGKIARAIARQEFAHFIENNSQYTMMA